MLALPPDARRPSIVLVPAAAPGGVAAALDGRFVVERLDAVDLAPRLAAAAPEALVLAGSEALTLCRAARAVRPLLSLPVLVVGAPLDEALAAGANDAVRLDVGPDELALRVAALARAQRAHEDALAEARQEERHSEEPPPDQKRLEEDHRRAQRGLSILAQAGEVLMRSLDARTRLSGLGSLVIPDFAERCGVFLVDEEGSVQLADAGARDPDDVTFARERLPPVKAGSVAPAVIRVVRTGRPVWFAEMGDAEIADVSFDAEHAARIRRAGISSWLCVPLGLRGRTLGALSFARVGGAPPFDAGDRELAEDLARRAALAVEGSELFAEAARERQRAEEANRIKDEFLANLSHELRTPLTSILGWVHILRTRTVAEEKRARALESVERNASALARLVEDLLDVSRIIAQRLTLTLGPVDLGHVVEAEVLAVRPLAEQRGLVLAAAVDPAAAAIAGDAERLRQVVANLLTNAIKFTPSGGTITVRLERERSRARLTVTDTGRGIPPDFLPFVFDRFRQADGGPTRAHGGLGIGLAIARHIVTLHQGSIEVESAGPDQGSTFTVRIPLGGAYVTPPLGAAVVSRLPDLRGVLVAVAGDDGETRALVTSALEPCGTAVVDLAADAHAADALWRGWPQVLVVALRDAADPPAILRELRDLSPDRGPRISAVAIMDRGPTERRARVLRAGFDVLVETPLDPAELIAAVASLCRRV